MIAVPAGVRVWLASGPTDMRRGMNGLALLVQEALKRDPHGGDLFVFRGKRGRPDQGAVARRAGDVAATPSGWSAAASSGRRRRAASVPISAAQLGYLLEGIDWRCPQHTWRPRRRDEAATRFDSAMHRGSLTSDALCGLLGAMTLGPMPCRTMSRALKRAAAGARGRAAPAMARGSQLRARAADDQALIAHLKLQIEKLRREQFGQRSERTQRLLDQLELQLEELEASATEDELAAERRRPGPRRWRPSPAGDRRASRSPSTCRASGWSCPAPTRLPVLRRHAAVASWARTSPRRWR